MRIKKLGVLALVLQLSLFALPVNAENRTQGDTIFEDPTGERAGSFVLGLSALIVAHQVFPSQAERDEKYNWPGRRKQQEALLEAESALRFARDLPETTEARLGKLAILEKEYLSIGQNESGKLSELNQRVMRLTHSRLYTLEQKQFAIKEAKRNIARARYDILKSAQKFGFLDKSLRIARYGTSLVLVGLAAYQWKAAFAEPTLISGKTYLEESVTE